MGISLVFTRVSVSFRLSTSFPCCQGFVAPLRARKCLSPANPPLYPQWQEYFHKYQPPTLIVWGKNDYIFPAEGAYPYQRDLKDVELHLLDTGHFALEEEGEALANHIRQFMNTHVVKENTMLAANRK